MKEITVHVYCNHRHKSLVRPLFHAEYWICHQCGAKGFHPDVMQDRIIGCAQVPK